MKKLILIGAILIAMLTVLGLQDKVFADEVNACYKKNNGQLRILKDGKKCLKSEIPIVLNIIEPSNDPAWKLNNNVDHCWNFSRPTKGVSGNLKLHFHHIGSGHNLISGVMTVTESGSNPMFLQGSVYGNAEIVDGEIYVTLSLAGIRDGIIGIDMQKAKLNTTSFNGTFETIGVYSDAVELSEGTLTYTTCQ